MRFIDLTGKVFGKLTVLEVIETSKRKKTPIRWICKCACGTITDVSGHCLKSGNSQSCGCTHFSHKMYKTKTYQVWGSMKQRCLLKTAKAYADYGGRGITICKRWYDFENFLEDMGEKPDGLELDRIDNSQGYSKSNCRWATRFQQSQNKRNNRNITFNGITKCISEWARELGMHRATLRQRLNRWSLERALSVPVGPSYANKRKSYVPA